MPTKQKIKNVNVAVVESMVKESGLSGHAIARALGIDPSAAHHLLNGRRHLKAQEVDLLASALNQPRNAVLEAFGAPGVNLRGGAGVEDGKDEEVEVKGWLDGSLIVRRDGLRGRHSVRAPMAGTHIAALRFQTAGTEISAWDGSLAFYKTIPAKGSVSELVGKFAIVKVQGLDDLRLRELKRGYEAGRYDLVAMSGRTIEKDVWVESAYSVLSIVL